MKTPYKTLTVAIAALVIPLVFVSNSTAQCGSAPAKLAHPANLHLQYGGGHLVRAAFPGERSDRDEDVEPIVGMWHVIFTAEGNKVGPPNGTPVDNAVVVWHSDKTEIMNSGRPPQDGDFCMGVWEVTGKGKYKLNHFAWAGNDTTNAPFGIGNPAGPTHIVEEVTVGPDGKHFTGAFTLDAYDTSGNVVTHIVGALKGTRITVDTTVSDLL
jgi:hypothetical protein